MSVELWWTVAMMRSLGCGMYLLGERQQHESQATAWRLNTLPVLFSTHIAFFFRSMHKGPARVEVIVEGRT